MLTKEEYLNLLRNNEVFKAILDKATSDAERRAIKAYTEDFVMGFYRNVMEPASKSIPEDPEERNKAYQEVHDELIKSGSIA